MGTKHSPTVRVTAMRSCTCPWEQTFDYHWFIRIDGRLFSAEVRTRKNFENHYLNKQTAMTVAKRVAEQIGGVVRYKPGKWEKGA